MKPLWKVKGSFTQQAGTFCTVLVLEPLSGTTSSSLRVRAFTSRRWLSLVLWRRRLARASQSWCQALDSCVLPSKETEFCPSSGVSQCRPAGTRALRNFCKWCPLRFGSCGWRAQRGGAVPDHVLSHALHLRERLLRLPRSCVRPQLTADVQALPLGHFSPMFALVAVVLCSLIFVHAANNSLSVN